MDKKLTEEANCHGEIEEFEDVVDKGFKELKNFEVLQDPPSDHRFINRNMQRYVRQIFSDTCSVGKRVFSESNFAKKIKTEWEILEATLPNSIMVRTYESRIDLMRACIVGLEGTPYCYGLFFFDIIFPNNYPAKPPELFYHAFGLELNPNLRKGGKVSLGLLNLSNWYQWLAQKELHWNPNKSDTLQVLLSIQNLILNQNPVLGGSQIDRERCLKGNKEIFMVSCESMLQTLRFPLSNFEVLIKGHFRKRAHSILSIYRAQMDSHSEKGMKELFFKLVKAFEANGAYCQHHYDKIEWSKEKETIF
ncbi:hypothetical protein K2173_008140 [Erythroxylum novogranatense]|uniref:UBC core domain-containing protein n=1 Tax=Erythroxylum novogranatense TaxID=1862640 RepID=A0AAV8S9H5_9ROSI|nr:hypothetical protein K2173_008140 [Erythroxylum novogranatense]